MSETLVSPEDYPLTTNHSSLTTSFDVSPFQTRRLPRVPDAVGPARLARPSRATRGQSHRSHHARHRRLDANISADHFGGHAAAQTDPPVLADQVPPHFRPVCIFLRLPAPDDLRLARQIFRRSRNAQGYRQA